MYVKSKLGSFYYKFHALKHVKQLNVNLYIRFVKFSLASKIIMAVYSGIALLVKV